LELTLMGPTTLLAPALVWRLNPLAGTSRSRTAPWLRSIGPKQAERKRSDQQKLPCRISSRHFCAFVHSISVTERDRNRHSDTGIETIWRTPDTFRTG
jgi:hypothetical protein